MTTISLDPNASTNAHAMPSQARAARLAGYGILLAAVLAILANVSAVDLMVVPGDGAATVENVASNATLFRIGLVGFGLLVLLDVVLSGALYVFFRRVSQPLAALAAAARLAYAAIGAVAGAHLAVALRLVTAPEAFGLAQGAVESQTMLSLAAFESTLHLGFLFYALHLLVIGYLALRSGFMPRLLGHLLVGASLGHAIDGFARLTLPADVYGDANSIAVLLTAVVAQLWFAFWLIRKAPRVAGQPPKRADGAEPNAS